MTTALPMQALLAQHIAIVGKVGSGKTYTGKGFVETLLAEKRRVCILDPTGVWWGLRSSPDGKRAGWPVAVFGGQHADVPIAEHSGATLAKVIASKNLPSIIDLSELLIGQRHRFATDFAEALYRDNRAPLHLVIDEADEFMPQNPLPETKRMLHHFDRIVRRGRVRGFRVMLITQRPAVLHKNVLTQANTLIAMRLTAPQDRNAIKEWIDGQADAVQGKEVLMSLARLQRGEGWVWAPEVDVLRRVTFPKISTFDSSRSPEDSDDIIEPAKLAEVDLSEIRKDFETVEAEARTVADLQAEVKRLKAQVTRMERTAAPTTVGMDPAEMERRVAEAVARLKPAPAVAAIPPKALALVAKAIAALQAVEAMSGTEVAATSAAPAVAPPRKPAARFDSRDYGAPVPDKATALHVRQGITGPEQRILDAVAWLEAIGVAEPEQPAVAFLADYTYGAGSYNNARGRLNQSGLVRYLPGGKIQLTDAGRALANQPDAPGSNAELHERVIAKLDGPAGRLLRPLIERYPQAMSNQDLALAAGYTAGAGSFNNARGRLRTLGLIDYPRPGYCQALPLLFPKGQS